MSRHRHFHAINQNYDEYDDDHEEDYDDEDYYGANASTDQYCVSPGTAAQFTFNRDGRGNTSFADYLSKEEENEIPEETITDILEDSGTFQKPLLSDEDEAKLRSCLDEIRNVIGDTIPDSIVMTTIIDCQFDCERSLDSLLTRQSSRPPKAKGDGLRPASQTPGLPVNPKVVANSTNINSTSHVASSANVRSRNSLPSNARLTSSSILKLQPQFEISKTSNSQPMDLQSFSSACTASTAGDSVKQKSCQSAPVTTSLLSSVGKSLALSPKSKPAQPKSSISNKLSLNNLKKLDLSSSASGSNSLSKLALNHLKVKPNTAETRAVGKPTPSLSLTNLGLQTNTNLFTALKLKSKNDLNSTTSSVAKPMEVTEEAPAHDEKVMKPSGVKLLSFDEPVNERLVARDVSEFGQILCSSVCREAPQGESLDWGYARQVIRAHPSVIKNPATSSTRSIDSIQPFDFSIPSPDDIIMSKQRGAFTRTGERIVLAKPSADKSKQASAKAASQKPPASPVVFRIGDSVKSDDENDSRLSESTSQLSLKPSNGATSQDRKETRTPVSAQLKGIKALIEGEGTRSPSLSRSSSKSKLERLDAEVEYARRAAEGKDLINLVVIGHVDAGKSTLMGHVLYQLGVVSQRQMHRYEMDSKKLGKASFMYAWVLDETEEERSRGVTMDVAQTRFETEKLIINLLDAPGHKDFIPNMITGAAQADCALLVVNATNGEFETGFELGGQTREHTLLIRSLGVSQLVVAINKMDTVNWRQQRFLEIANKLSTFLRQAGFKDADVSFIPCSGLNGVNLIKPPTDIPEFSWYTKTPLIAEIENFRPPVRLTNKPLRMCVQDIFKGQGGSFSVAGRMEAGDIQNGDRVLVMPCCEPASVKGILIDEAPERIGFAGDYITLQLVGIDIQQVHVGCVLCDPSNPIPVVNRFRARLVIFNIDLPITKGSPVVYHSQSLNEPANITRLISQLHKNTGEVLKSKPRCLTKNSTAVVEITLARPQCVELFKNFKDLGRFMLRSEGHTIAAGIVMEFCQAKN